MKVVWIIMSGAAARTGNYKEKDKKKEVYRKVGVCIKGNTNVCCEYDYNKVMQEVAINARK